MTARSHSRHRRRAKAKEAARLAQLAALRGVPLRRRRDEDDHPDRGAVRHADLPAAGLARWRSR